MGNEWFQMVVYLKHSGHDCRQIIESFEQEKGKKDGNNLVEIIIMK